MSWKDIVEKYGLDVSEVTVSEVFEINRLDAEFYKPEYLKTDKFLLAKQHFLLNKNEVVSGPFGSTLKSEEYIDRGVRLIRVQDIKQRYFLDKDSAVFISEKSNNKIKNSELKTGDLVVSKVGNTIGLVAHIDEELKRANVSENNIGIKLEKYPELTKYSILTFLNSKYGQSQILRRISGNAQPKLNVFSFTEIIIPKLTATIEEEISKAIKTAYHNRINSENLYSQAEQLLLAELGLSDYIPNDANISIRDLFECLQDDRFDAEYWMPKYDEIIEKIKEYKSGFSTIGKEFEQIKNNFKRQNDKEYNYIEIGDVNVFTGEVEYNAIIGKELPANAKIKFGKRQLITSKVRPNRGATAILNNHDGFIGSGAFTALVEKGNINLETLMVYLKTEHIRELLLRYNTGTSYPVIIDNDILELPIPLLDKNIQARISELTNSSSIAREQSKTLLEKAKRAVEIFIEQDEAKALEYLAS